MNRIISTAIANGRHNSSSSSSTIKMNFKNVTHCIFDMDGLLLDTEHIYENVVRDIAKSFNKTYPYDVRLKILGTTEQNTAKIACQELELPIKPQEFSIRFSELLKQRLGDSPLMLGAERLLKHLHKNQIPICLATSSSKEMAELKAKRHSQLFDLFNHKVMGSTDPDVKAGKPSPDIFLVAASRFPDSPAPEKCLVFEDAPNGVRAACLAGMQSVMVPDPHIPQEMCCEATIVLKTLEDFQPENFGLPKFND